MILYKRDYFIIFLIIVAIALWFLRTYQEKDLSVKGVDIYDLQRQIEEQRKENALLRETIIRLQAYTELEKKAEGQGFRRAMPTDYVIFR